MNSSNPVRVLIVDLNNFATFPTLAIGILIAALRGAGQEVTFLAPKIYAHYSREREHPEHYRDHLMRRFHLSSWRPGQKFQDTVRNIRYTCLHRPNAHTLRDIERALAQKPDVLLLSAYLHHYATVVAAGKLARAAGVPLLVGGPAFNHRAVVESWRTIPGLTAILAGKPMHSPRNSSEPSWQEVIFCALTELPSRADGTALLLRHSGHWTIRPSQISRIFPGTVTGCTSSR